MSERGYSLDTYKQIQPGDSSINLEKEVEVELPEVIEKNLEEEILPKFLNLAEQAGVTKEEIKRYKACYESFSDRPSQLGISDRFNFSPNPFYFSPKIGFNKNFQAMPDVLEQSDFKLKILREGQKADKPKTKKIDAEAIKKNFEEKEIRYANINDKPEREKINSYEKYLGQINRAIYKIHDSLHIYQTINIGDQLNRLKDQLDAKNIFDPEKEKEIISNTGYGKMINWKWPDWLMDSVLIADEILEKEWSSEKDDEGIKNNTEAGAIDKESQKKEKAIKRLENLNTNPQISNNEATMDIISEWVIKEEVEKYPEFQLWLHNTLSHLVATTEQIHDQFKKNIAENKKFDIDDQPPHEQVFHAIDMISNAYFSVFENSTESSQKLTRMEYKMGGKPAQATIADGSYFDRFTITNLRAEINQMDNLIFKYNNSRADSDDQKKTREELEELVNNKVTFPSGATYLEWNASFGPITKAGAELSANIINKLTEWGQNGENTKDWFIQIQNYINEPTPEKQNKIISRCKKLLGLELDAAELEEMNNIVYYLHYNKLDSNDYPFQMALRKEVMDKLKKEHPEQIEHMVKWTFFETPIYFNAKNYYNITGFKKEVKKDNGVNFKEKTNFKGNWNEITKETNLGLMGINMTTVEQNDMDAIKKLFDQGYIEKDHTEDIKLLVEIARKQKERLNK